MNEDMQVQTAAYTVLDLTGPDAGTFLQGYVTADVDDIDEHVALPMAFTNIKGRVTASGWLWGAADHVRLLVHCSVVESLASDLAKYLMFAKSELTPSSIQVRLRQAAAEGVELPPTGWRLVLDSDAPPESPEAFQRACIEVGFVVVTDAIAGDLLPQALGLTEVGAVNFAKGCYLGQEIVARAEHRGQVKRSIARYDLAQPGQDIVVGGDVYAEEKKVGTVVAIAEDCALVSLREDHARLTVGDAVLLLSGDSLRAPGFVSGA